MSKEFQTVHRQDKMHENFFVRINHARKRKVSFRVVLLVGGVESGLISLTQKTPKALLPIMNRPVIEYNLSFLKRWGVREVVICTNGENQRIQEYLRNGERYGLQLHYVKNPYPRGTAGSVKDTKGCYLSSSEGQPFLVISGNLYLDFNLDTMLQQHREKKSWVTIGVTRDPVRNGSGYLENLHVSEGLAVKKYTTRHPSEDRRSPYKPFGVYIIEEDVLDFIPDQGYFGFKEQLMPDLQRSGRAVFACEMDGKNRKLNTVEDYCALNFALLKNLKNSHRKLEEKDIIVMGRGTDVHPDVHMIGPVIIGDGCVVEKKAVIIGPTVIGDNCRIGSRSIVRESVLWSNTVVEKSAYVHSCVLLDGGQAKRRRHFSHFVLTGEKLQGRDLGLLKKESPLYSGFRTVLETGFGTIHHRFYLIWKRILDIIMSLVFLSLWSPFMLAIAVLVKFDSKGPVLFRQRRCGKYGKIFTMLKFRSMVQDAEKRKEDFLHENQVDGPMFKIYGDPRVTKVGRVIRRLSLDELPQFVNVLKGEMSLVGPRPLSMKEMQFNPNWRDMRLSVKPGITGLWQVNGQYITSFHEWIEFDVDYVKHQSMILDMKILWKTIVMTLQRVFKLFRKKKRR